MPDTDTTADGTAIAVGMAVYTREKGLTSYLVARLPKDRDKPSCKMETGEKLHPQQLFATKDAAHQERVRLVLRSIASHERRLATLRAELAELEA